MNSFKPRHTGAEGASSTQWATAASEKGERRRQEPRAEAAQRSLLEPRKKAPALAGKGPAPAEKASASEKEGSGGIFPQHAADAAIDGTSGNIDRLSALGTVSPLLPVTAPPPPVEHNEGFRLPSPAANADINGGDFYDAPSPTVQVPEVASSFADAEFAPDCWHFQDPPSPTPRVTAATSSVAENFGKAPNPTPLVINLVANMPSTIADNDNAGNSGDIADAPSPSPRVAGDGGPAGYNSSGPGANGSGLENPVVSLISCPFMYL
ncbi:hypothetical protein C8J57DRAFT_1541502 [Mycena rebaudengoi]|nr:hypothetical protein C8J57DRAFT_1541502 [Mycena rebaudengoi]